MNGTKNRTRRLVLTAMLFALAIVLSVVEGMLPAPVPVPGVKFGLSNIVVMYALFFLEKQDAFLIAFLKGLFAGLTRGAMAGLLSMAGGLLSIFVMVVLRSFLKEKGSCFIYSMSGALVHNLGQFIVISMVYTSVGIWHYLPVLIVGGIVAGMITAVLLKLLLPVLGRLQLSQGG